VTATATITNSIPGPCRSEQGSDADSLVTSWRQQAQRLQREVHALYLTFKHRRTTVKHPRTPWCAKIVAACTVGYVFSPVQLIPNFIPVTGSLDDVVVLLLGAKVLSSMTPPHVLTECREFANAFELQKREGTKTKIALAASVIIAQGAVKSAERIWLVLRAISEATRCNR
jgi:uncharacterized membrane protein YkvA (DUF1232 family)